MRKFVLALAVAASVLTGCEFTTQDASRPNVIGPLVRVEASGCPGGPIVVPGARQARVKACNPRVDVRRARAAAVPGWQLLVAYLVPAAADTPDTVDVAGSVDETLQRSRGPRGLPHLDAAVPSGGERELRVRLTPRGVRFLRDRRSVRLDLSATIRGRGSWRG